MDNELRTAIDKKHFAEALKEVPSKPERVRDSQLRKIAMDYRHLKECDDEIPCSLARFGLPDRMTFDDFIWKLVGQVVASEIELYNRMRAGESTELLD